MFEYDTGARVAAEKLDKYDLTEILRLSYDSGYRDPDSIIDNIILNHKELKSEFANLTKYEFMKYLCERYPVRFEEVPKYRMWYMR